MLTEEAYADLRYRMKQSLNYAIERDGFEKAKDICEQVSKETGASISEVSELLLEIYDETEYPDFKGTVSKMAGGAYEIVKIDSEDH